MNNVKYPEKLQLNREDLPWVESATHISQMFNMDYDILIHLINLSLKNHTFPAQWKTQLIHPNYKKGDKTRGKNFAQFHI